MATILSVYGIKIYKFSDTDRKQMKHSFQYAIQQGNNIKGFKTLTQVNNALGWTRKGQRLTSSSFRKR